MSYYATDMAGNLKKKGHDEIAHALEEIRPEDIWKFARSSPENLENLSNSHSYDQLLRQIVSKRKPALASQVNLISSNYNFFKNKLNESFHYKSIENIEARAKLVQPTKAEMFSIPKMDDSALTLNADQYIANRQTRAIFWDAIKNKHDVEFYMEDMQTALSSIESRGGRIVGEVQPLANNYNKNYLVFYEAENRYAHIVTDISGTDRLHHLTKQLSIIKWDGTSGAERFSDKVPVFGPLKNIMNHERERLVSLMEVLPKADHVVLGQKGAMERNVRLAQKVELILDHVKKKPSALNQLEPAERALIAELQESQDLFKSLYQAPKWDGIFEKFKASVEDLPETFDFNIDLNSHSIADVNIVSKTGKTKRIRLISNVWGNEAKPIADALIETGHTNFTYIGTAGGLTKDYRVGDVVSPAKVQLQSGLTIDLPPPSFKPEGLKEGGSLTQVASLFDESQEWLAKQKSKGHDLVEMEVGYLAESFHKKPGVKFNVFLLVSDMVGEEGETLDQASSSVRKKAQLNTLYKIFEAEKLDRVIPPVAAGPGEVNQVILELEPRRSAISIFQVNQKLKTEHKGRIPGKSVVKAALEENASFTPALLQKRLEMVQDFLNESYLISKSEGKTFEIMIEKSVFDGSYHPKNKIKLGILDRSKLDFSKLEELRNSDPEFKKFIVLDLVTDAGDEVPVMSKEIPKLDLLRNYNEVALTEGGLIGRISKSGNLAFSALPVRNECKLLLKAAK